MDSVHNPRVAIVSDSSLQRLALAHAVKGHGYDLALNIPPERLDQKTLANTKADVWLVDMHEEDDDLLDKLLSGDTPILFGVEQAPVQGTRAYPRWERRVFIKLHEVIGQPVISESLEPLEKVTPKPVKALQLVLPPEISGRRQSPRLEYVCVLAASLGGPAAVKEFLDYLPGGLPVAFLLAQHIDVRMQESLTRVLVRHNHIPCRMGKGGEALKHGELLIAPVETEIDFSADGQVVSRDMPWDGPYSPSIDQVLANVSRRFGKRSIAIIFSGMGGDGSISGPLMVESGGVIWAQESGSCACASQPDSMRSTGCVSFSGKPLELAQKLVSYINTGLHTTAA
jgi:chemosensory pili system protein ChpB (putative protein-glutamate methylesterase)